MDYSQTVQQQQPGVGCGVFAAAFASDCVRHILPHQILYSEELELRLFT